MILRSPISGLTTAALSEAATAAVHRHDKRRESATDRWVENGPAARTWSCGVAAELAAYRHLLLLLIIRDLKVRYKQTVLGVAWAAIQPIAGALVFSAIFSRIGRLPSDGIPYPLFVYTGLAVWTYVSGAVSSAAASLVENRSLITKVYFPRLLVPLAAVLSALVDLCIALTILAGLMMFYGGGVSGAVVALPLCIIGVTVVALGVGLWLSALNVLYRDVRYALGFALQLWFFATPIAFSRTLLHTDWWWVFALNPLVGVLEAFRWCLLGGNWPGASLIASAAAGGILLITGASYFHHVERRLADGI